MVFDLLDAAHDALPRLELYQKLQASDELQIALLNVFTDIVNFSLHCYQYLRRGTFSRWRHLTASASRLTKRAVRLSKILGRSFDQDIIAVISDLERHAKVADQTAIAVELLRAAEFRKASENARQEELKTRCTKWLEPFDVQTLHQRNSMTRVAGTCDWIASHNLYLEWSQQEEVAVESRKLFITGIPGCGKSILASSIVDRMQENHYCVLFFAFSNCEGRRQDSESLIRTLLSQLLTKLAKPSIIDRVQRLRSADRPPSSELWKCFQDILIAIDAAVYCIVDSVDECLEFDRSVFKPIVRAMEECPRLRLLLLGRPATLQDLGDSSIQNLIELDANLLRDDIALFVSKSIARSKVLSTSRLRGQISADIKAKSDGTFLWAHFMLEDLEKSSSVKEIEQRLENLPQGLEQAYDLIFRRLGKSLDRFEAELVKVILGLMVVAYRPLSFDELRYANAFRVRSQRLASESLVDFLLLLPCQRVVEMCGGLIFADNSRLHLTHSSVKDYLSRPEAQWTDDMDNDGKRFSIDLSQTHGLLGSICLDCINSESENDSISLDVEINDNEKPMLQYATLHVFYHLNRSWPLSPDTLPKVLHSLNSIASVKWVERFYSHLISDYSFTNMAWEARDFLERAGGSDLDQRILLAFSSGVLHRSQSSSAADQQRQELREDFVNLLAEEDAGQNPIMARLASPGPEASSKRSKPVGQNSQPGSLPIGKVTRLIKDHNKLNITTQLQVLLNLQGCLLKARKLTDPLKLLFRLILEKASIVPTFALIGIADFYYQLDKFEEEFEFRQAALNKIRHQETPLKYHVMEDVAYCYSNRSLLQEASVTLDATYNGRRMLLSDTHDDTLRSLQDAVFQYKKVNNYAKVRKLCNSGLEALDSLPGRKIDIKLQLQSILLEDLRHNHRVETQEITHLESCVIATVASFKDSFKNDSDMGSSDFEVLANAHHALNEYKRAIQLFQLAIEASRKEKIGSVRKQRLEVLRLQKFIASTDLGLGHYNKAEELCENFLEEEIRILGPSHYCVEITNRLSNDIRQYKDHYLNSLFPGPTGLGFRRHSTDFGLIRSFDNADSFDDSDSYNHGDSLDDTDSFNGSGSLDRTGSFVDYDPFDHSNAPSRRHSVG